MEEKKNLTIHESFTVTKVETNYKLDRLWIEDDFGRQFQIFISKDNYVCMEWVEGGVRKKAAINFPAFHSKIKDIIEQCYFNETENIEKKEEKVEEEVDSI